jgi:lipopolysaccharide export system protein LptA
MGEKFVFNGTQMSSNMAEGKEITTLTGNAQISSEKIFLKAEILELSGKNFEILIARNSVSLHLKDKNIFATCDELYYDRTKKILRLRGQVVLEDKKNKVIMRANFIEALDDGEIVRAQVGVRIIKEETVCQSEFANYDRKAETLELTGWPVVRRNGDEYKAKKILVDLKTDEIVLEGEVSGEIQSEEDKTGE